MLPTRLRRLNANAEEGQRGSISTVVAMPSVPTRSQSAEDAGNMAHKNARIACAQRAFARMKSRSASARVSVKTIRAT